MFLSLASPGDAWIVGLATGARGAAAADACCGAAGVGAAAIPAPEEAWACWTGAWGAPTPAAVLARFRPGPPRVIAFSAKTMLQALTILSTAIWAAVC